MRWIDLLRMSSSSLKRRKLRTFLTVLGVVIGTASIVVMVSLGLGLQKSVYDQVEQAGGVTTIQVSGQNGMGMSTMMGGASEQEQSEKYITDDTIEELKTLENVEIVSPVLNISTVMMQGRYESYIEIQGMEHDALAKLNIPLREGGTLPKVNSSSLELVVGNIIPTWFMDKVTGKGFWETGEMPDLDFEKKSSFLILDQESYMNGNVHDPALGTEGGSAVQKKPVKKHVVKASGVVAGDENTYSTHSYSVYCDLGTLKNVLKKEFAGRAIPGQPTRKNGKPYPYLTYTYAHVQVDDMEHVEAVAETIRSLGYNTQSNMELIDSMKKQLFLIQAVLGGIGAVSLLVAAIGIANTMMMSIYERTKEIGVIKVLGCGLKNIKQMFLMEAGFIGFFGGLIGNIISFLISFGINTVAKAYGNEMGISGGISYIPPWLFLASLIFAVFVGMVAGYFPALRAMRLSPLAAIRNE